MVTTKRQKHRLLALTLLLVALFCLFSGCGSDETASDRRTLWVVTEQTTWDRSNGQLELVKEAFEESHQGVTIQVDYLPASGQEREVRLQQLRTQILQGGGPDCYLLPTDNKLILDKPVQYSYVTIEPLFPDVEIAMRNGLFTDVSAYYDADEALGKEALCTAVMDAGVVDGARYVLPLRYDVPVICADNAALEAAGLDPAILEQDIGTVMEAVRQTGDPVLAGGILWEKLDAFSDFLDYDSCNATLDEEAVSQYMEAYRALKALVGDAYYEVDSTDPSDRSMELAGSDAIRLERLDPCKYIFLEYEEANAKVAYYPLWIGSVQDTFEYVPWSDAVGTELSVLPMRTVGSGKTVATVTYYGAVGSSCDDPALAYEFLREFLSEDVQWERNRPERKHWRDVKGAAANTSNDLQYPGLIENGWPVRDPVFFQTLWDVRRIQIYLRDVGLPIDTPNVVFLRMRRIGRKNYGDWELPIMHTQIDLVRFNTTMSDSFAEYLARLNDPENGNVPTEADVKELARQFAWELRWHVSEG